MAREYRIDLDENIDRVIALDMLSKSPYFHRPSQPFQEGEVWLSTDLRLDYPEGRLFPRSFGFVLEITRLSGDLLQSLTTWITQLRSLGVCSIVDNDTDEVIEVLQ